jgi:hypothetical protein
LVLWYVNVAHFLCSLFFVGSLLCIFCFSFLMIGIGKLLLAVVRIVCHSASSFSCERGHSSDQVTVCGKFVFCGVV